MLAIATPTLARATPVDDAQAVFARFLDAFTAADIDATVNTFWPDALLWGNTSTSLAATPDAVRAYFKPMAARKPNEWKATLLERSTVGISDSVVVISGLWQIERTGEDGKPVLAVSRVSFAATKRGNEWRMAQLHSSARPALR